MSWLNKQKCKTLKAEMELLIDDKDDLEFLLSYIDQRVDNPEMQGFYSSQLTSDEIVRRSVSDDTMDELYSIVRMNSSGLR